MPSRRKRAFSDLERMAKQAGLQAADGSVLGNYLDFKAGKRKKQRRKTTTLTAVQRQRVAIALLPFNKAVVAGAIGRYSTTITRWSADARTGLGVSDAELGYTGTNGVTQSSNFFPATLKPSVRTSTTATTPVSGVTGKEYTYYPSNSYSIPFGRTTAGAATDTEEGRRGALVSEMKSLTNSTPARSIGYEPEVWRYDPRAGASDLTGTPAPPAAPAGA